MRKLFYEDSHLTRFRAQVIRCVPAEGGWRITLDATAFYPEGGGQACDIGTLGNVRVLDVQEEGAEIWHLCDGPLEPGTQVEGCIDWQRRFDLMQQHTGEHILSGLIHEEFGYHNTGFHVGADCMEVDFDGPIPPEALAQLERRANEAVWADIPVQCWIPSPEELAALTYRTKRTLEWPVRIVRIPGYDSCACCGVHVRRTGEVGLIKILSWTRLRGGIRLQMVCGARAYRHTVAVFEENRQVSQQLSVPMEATAAGVRRLYEVLAEEKARSAGLRDRIFQVIAEGYRGREWAVHLEPGLEPGQVRQLADRLADAVTGWCAVFSGADGSWAYCLASRERDLRLLGRKLTDALRGRGGGKPNFQQGSLQATQAQILEFFQTDPTR